MTRWAVALLPVLGIVAVDPVAYDWQAVKYAALMAGAFFCLLLGLWDRRVAWTRLSLPIWVFLAVRGSMLYQAPYSGRALRWWAVLFALACVHHLAVPRRWLRRNAILLLAFLAGVTAVWLLVQWAGGDRQAQAFFANRNFAGAGLAMLLPFALASRWRWPLLGIVAAGLAATQSRGGLLAAACAATLWFVWERRRWPVLVAVPAIVLAGALLFGQANTVKVRLHWYEAAWNMGKEHPLAGVGADGFAREYPPRRPLEEHAISGGRRVHAVHNDYLESWAEGGALGLGAHLLLLFAAAWAARRHRLAASSLLAFAVASLVDLPLRDPSLLALAFLSLTLAAGRRTFRAGPVPPALLALIAVFALGRNPFWHWRADRHFGRYLATGEARLLGQALEREPRHPEALIERSLPDDLALLIEMEPHHAGAHYNRTRHLPPEEAKTALREILVRHDPHHTLTCLRLAQLSEPLEAVSVLERAVRANPRPYRPWLMLARIHRERGQLVPYAERNLRAAETAEDGPVTPEEARAVVRERLEFELASLREGRRTSRRIYLAVRQLPAAEISARIEKLLADAEEAKHAVPAVKLAREPGEDDAAYALRIDAEKRKLRVELREKTKALYVEARSLAEALTAHDPQAAHFRLLGRIVRGEGDFPRATQMEALALFLEMLQALRDGDEVKAKTRLRRALRAYPGLEREKVVREALRAFGRNDPAGKDRARRLFAGKAELLDALGG